MVQAAEAPAPDPGLIGPANLRRLLAALIEAHQDHLVRAGRLSEAQLLSARLATRGPEAAGEIVIGEADLGLDSLERLNVIMAVDRYFDLRATGVEDYLVVRRRLADWVELVHWHLAQMGKTARIGFATSGSTGAPKAIVHDAATLVSEINALIDGPLAALAPGAQVLALVPPHHIYGFLWTVLLPERLGAEVIDLSKSTPAAAFRAARPGDLVVATPFGWSQMAEAGGHLPDGVTGVSSGGPTTEETWAAARRIGLTRLIEVYGSSETGGIGWRDSADAPYRLIGDIRGDGPALSRAGGPALDIPDVLDWDDRGRFRVLGRRDTVVQVAGTNVNLGALRRRMIAETGAEDVALRLSGDRLKAFFAATEAAQPAVRGAVGALLPRLATPERPAAITYGPALPRSATGKLTDW
ncbi:4-coumarate--CoA ligase [Rhodobacterales bacterium HKCCE3408]|nr:4-coumarate--CoA ligase [Rhodobacterales bacterium HKCCE3408]